MPFKTFTDGSVLTANEVNEYMMDQQVMVFDTGAARDAALVEPIHGMFAYLRDQNRLSFYNGSTWRLV
jgi:hypothetical protein